MRHPYLDHAGVVALAHRGGGGEAPENSASAFHRSVALGYRYIETDVRATKDGVLVISHDATLDRSTDSTGRISDLTWAQLTGVRVGDDPMMTLADTLAAFPTTRFNLDLKSDDTVVPFLQLARESPAILHRVCVGSFSGARLRLVREALGAPVATSMGPREVAALVAHRRGAPRRVVARTPVAAQVPISMYGAPIVDADFVRAAHALGIAVHVWTVDDPATMDSLLDLGVDGIVTDRPTVLRDVLERRGQWHPA